MDNINLSNVARALKAHFQPGEEEHYRVGPTWEQGGERYTRPLAYIDARAVFDRLDEVVGPDNWNTHLERLGPGVYLCRLTILGVARSDVGMAGGNESEVEKSGASDAIKRAAVQHGIGRYLYAIELPAVKLDRKGSDWVLPRGWKPPAAQVDRHGVPDMEWHPPRTASLELPRPPSSARSKWRWPVAAGARPNLPRCSTAASCRS